MGVALSVACSCVEADMKISEGKGLDIVLIPGQSSETCKDVNVNKDLSKGQTNDISSLLSEFRDVWKDVPGKTNVIMKCYHLFLMNQ